MLYSFCVLKRKSVQIYLGRLLKREYNIRISGCVLKRKHWLLLDTVAKRGRNPVFDAHRE